MTLEMVAQGTLVERMRAGGAGLAAFYTPVSVGTALADGKDVRYFDGRPYVLEHAITTDFALIRAHRADPMGNLQVRGGSRNFNVSFAKAARLAIAEVDEIVEVGELRPGEVDLPGVFVGRVVRSVVRTDVKNPAHAAEPPGRQRPRVPRQAGVDPRRDRPPHDLRPARWRTADHPHPQPPTIRRATQDGRR
jgi:3-oxoacid CoA-transferase